MLNRLVRESTSGQTAHMSLREPSLSKAWLALSGLAAALVLAACASRPTAPTQPTFDSLDPQRFAGRWYVIAHIPYFAERGRVGAYVEYVAREDGRFDDYYVSRKGSFDAPERRQRGLAWIPDPAHPGRWRVRFYWPFTADFYVLYVDEAYEHALLGHPSRDLAWIYARTPRIDEARYAELLGRLADLGYDATRLVRVPQFPDQLSSGPPRPEAVHQASRRAASKVAPAG